MSPLTFTVNDLKRLKVRERRDQRYCSEMVGNMNLVGTYRGDSHLYGKPGYFAVGNQNNETCF